MQVVLDVPVAVANLQWLCMCMYECVIYGTLTLPSLHRCAAGSKWKTHQGGEGEIGPLQASEAPGMAPPNTAA